jgi:hypothetical protein
MAPTEDFETITVRLPAELKTVVEQTAGARGVSVTTFMRQALQDSVAPRARMFERPGFSEKFDAFLKPLRRQSVLILVTPDDGRNRAFFEGPIDPNLTNESLVAVCGKGDQRFILPRADVVGWFGAESGGVVQKMAMALMKQGWRAAVTPY